MKRAAAFVILALVVAACNDSDAPPAPRTPANAATNATALPHTATRPTEPGATPGGGVVEVQGIVGSVDQAQRTIRINRLQGADVDVIELSTATRIRDARGTTVRLADIRPSDRVVARGRVDETSLIATEVTVSQVVPGGEPGG